MKKIDFFRHNLSSADIENLVDTLNSVILTTGPKVAEFEKKFATLLSAPYAVGLTSCTEALFLSLKRYNIGQGDEVIVPAMTFAATASAVLEAGATPVMADVCPKSALITPQEIKKVMTDKTKAVIPVHLYGRMVDMKGIMELAKPNNLIVIEDAAHCVEGSRHGYKPGSLGHTACFSFYATKNLTSGEGGALVCKNEEDANWFKSARHHGITKNAAYRYTKKFEHWDMDMMGWKCNMNDIQASLLLGQIDRVEENLKKREHLLSLYTKHLSGIDGISFIEQAGEDERSAIHLFTLLLPKSTSRDEVLWQMQEQGIGCAVNYRAMHNLRFFKENFGCKPQDYPIANDMGNRTITLPLYPSMNPDNVEYIANKLRQVLNEQKK